MKTRDAEKKLENYFFRCSVTFLVAVGVCIALITASLAVYGIAEAYMRVTSCVPQGEQVKR